MRYLLVESLEDERDDPGQDAEEQEHARDGHPGNVGQNNGQWSHFAHVPVKRSDGDQQMADAILSNWIIFYDMNMNVLETIKDYD